MNIQTAVSELADQIRRDFPWSCPELTTFESGAADLSVRTSDEMWVMAYMPSLGNVVGVSRASTATFGWEGFENVFHDFNEAREFLLSALRKEKDR